LIDIALRNMRDRFPPGEGRTPERLLGFAGYKKAPTAGGN